MPRMITNIDIGIMSCSSKQCTSLLTYMSDLESVKYGDTGLGIRAIAVPNICE